MSEFTAEEHMLATAQALGLSPRQRREAMDRMQAASDDIERSHESGDL